MSLSTISHLFIHSLLYELDLGQKHTPALVLVVSCVRAHASANVQKIHEDHKLFNLSNRQAGRIRLQGSHLQHSLIHARIHTHPEAHTHPSIKKVPLIRLHVIITAGAQPLDLHHLGAAAAVRLAPP